jgi:hypothetical protein
MKFPVVHHPNKETIDSEVQSTKVTMEAKSPWKALNLIPPELTAQPRSLWKASDFPSLDTTTSPAKRSDSVADVKAKPLNKGVLSPSRKTPKHFPSDYATSTAPSAQRSDPVSDIKAKPSTEDVLYPKRKPSKRFPLHYEGHNPPNVSSGSLAEETGPQASSGPMTPPPLKTSVRVPWHLRSSTHSQDNTGWSESIREPKRMRTPSTISQPRISTVDRPLRPGTVPNSMSLPEVEPTSLPSTEDQPPFLKAVEWTALSSARSQTSAQWREPLPPVKETGDVSIRLGTKQGSRTLAPWEVALRESRSIREPLIGFEQMRIASTVDRPRHPWAVKQAPLPEVKTTPLPSTVNRVIHPWAANSDPFSEVKPVSSPEVKLMPLPSIVIHPPLSSPVQSPTLTNPPIERPPSTEPLKRPSTQPASKHPPKNLYTVLFHHPSTLIPRQRNSWVSPKTTIVISTHPFPNSANNAAKIYWDKYPRSITEGKFTPPMWQGASAEPQVPGTVLFRTWGWLYSDWQLYRIEVVQGYVGGG